MPSPLPGEVIRSDQTVPGLPGVPERSPQLRFFRARYFLLPAAGSVVVGALFFFLLVTSDLDLIQVLLYTHRLSP